MSFHHENSAPIAGLGRALHRETYIHNNPHMSGTSENVLVVVGCGPGIGVATACLFAKHAFSKIALIARDARRLQKHRSTVIEAAARSDKQDVDVRYWDVDISNAAALNDALKDIENMGQVACVLFNAARVGPSKFFAFEEQDLIHDFQVLSLVAVS